MDYRLRLTIDWDRLSTEINYWLRLTINWDQLFTEINNQHRYFSSLVQLIATFKTFHLVFILDNSSETLLDIVCRMVYRRLNKEWDMLGLKWLLQYQQESVILISTYELNLSPFDLSCELTLRSPTQLNCVFGLSTSAPKKNNNEIQ